MGWIDTWYPETKAKLTELLGVGPADVVNGTQLPALRAIDTLAVLGLMTPSLISALNSFATTVNGDIAKVAYFEPESDGIIDTITGVFADNRQWVDAKTYIGMFPLIDLNTGVGKNGWERSKDGLFGDVYRLNGSRLFGLFDDTASLDMLRQAMTDFQRACDASAAAIAVNQANTLRVMDEQEAQTFWGAVRALGADLDVLNENPPPQTSDVVSGGVRAAVDKSEQFVGKAAAEISNEAGKAAGNVASGFFEQAGMLSVAIAALVIFLYVK